MRRVIGWVGVWAIAIGAAVPAAAQGRPRAEAPAGSPAPAGRPRADADAIPRPTDDPENARKIDQILAAWQERSGTIKQLDAAFRRVDTNRLWKSKKEYEGRALLQGPNLACLDVHLVDPQDKAKTTFFERIICTGDEVIHYVGDKREIIVFPLGKDRQRALQEGPLPFLFDMKAEEIKRRYRMFLIQEDAKTYRIQIIPVEAIDRDAFAQAFIDLNKATYLPDALQLHSPNGKEAQTYRFTAIKANAPINPENFRLKPIKNWKIVRNPEPGAPPGPDAAPREPAVGRRPAARPR